MMLSTDVGYAFSQLALLLKIDLAQLGSRETVLGISTEGYPGRNVRERRSAAPPINAAGVPGKLLQHQALLLLHPSIFYLPETEDVAAGQSKQAAATCAVPARPTTSKARLL